MFTDEQTDVLPGKPDMHSIGNYNDTASSFPTEDLRWSAIVSRDTSADGTFVHAVKSTGIYCRPGCPARLPKLGNVAFFATSEDAAEAGYRACKRCRPDGLSMAEKGAEAVSEACRLIETSEELPKLDDLAAAVGMSSFHFHRRFKAITGVTPKA